LLELAAALFVLAGLDVVYGEAGTGDGAATPIGLMGRPATGVITGALHANGDGAGIERSETLYI